MAHSALHSQQQKRDSFARAVTNLSELLILILVCVSPWLFGAVDETFELVLFIGLAVVLILWGVRGIAEREVTVKRCSVTLCLITIFILGVWQLVPLPRSIFEHIAPSTSATYQRLMPKVLESISEDPLPGKSAESNFPISFYPGATRHWLVNMLALIALFVTVRNHADRSEALTKLSIAIVINGSLLAVYGVMQFFSSSDRGLIYWTYSSSGAAFGPFVNRNHFAFHTNLAIGFAIGLLLSRATRHQVGNQPLLRGLLRDPTALWIAGGLALMISSTIFCLSRGGFLALTTALAIVGPLAISGGRSLWRAAALGLSLAIALAMLTWFGLDRVEARLATLWSGEAMLDGRGYLMRHCWPLVRAFGLWGTGYGTFQYVEPLVFHTATDVGTVYEHAHNDYLEDLIEGGALRLGLRLIAIVLVVRLALQAFRRPSPDGSNGMLLGLLFGFITVVVHSFFEFGLFVPAIAWLATVTTAHLCNTADRPHGGRSDAFVFRPPAPIVALVLFGVLAWIFCDHGARNRSVHALRHEARNLRRMALAGTGSAASEIAVLHEAAKLRPDDATIRVLLADAYFATSREVSASSPRDSEQALGAGLQQILRARELCPLLATPHARLAYYVGHFASAESRTTYMDRAKFLAPADPQLWYLCGQLEWEDGNQDAACENWKRSLALSPRYRTRILSQSAAGLSTDQFLNQLLPDEPQVLWAAAHELYPRAEDAPLRKPLFEKAIRLAEIQPQPWTAEQWHTVALLKQALELRDEALAAYRQAVRRDPLRVDWRCELASLLHESGDSEEAWRQVRAVLTQQPQHPAALKLADELGLEIAEEKLKRSQP